MSLANALNYSFSASYNGHFFIKYPEKSCKKTDLLTFLNPVFSPQLLTLNHFFSFLHVTAIIQNVYRQ